MLDGKIVFEGTTAKGLNVLLRYPQQGDAQALLDYVNPLSAEQTFILLQGEQLTLEDEQKYLDRELSLMRAGTGVQLLAFVDDMVVGDTEIQVRPGISEHVGALGIGIAKAYRGQGLGELMMETIINEAMTHLPKVQIITLRVFGNNEVALNLYRKLGFVEYGRLPGGMRHRGSFVDDVHLFKRIRD